MSDETKRPQPISRRQLFTRTTTLAAGVAAAANVGLVASPAHATKVSKKIAGYQPSPKGSQHCAICTYYLGNHKCRLVAGNISPNGWCTYFAKKS